MKVTNLITGQTFRTFTAAAKTVGGTRTGFSYAYSTALSEARVNKCSPRPFPYKGQMWRVEGYCPRPNRARQLSLKEKVLTTWPQTQGDLHSRIRATANATKQSFFVVALVLHHHGVEKIRRADLEQAFAACRPKLKTA